MKTRRSYANEAATAERMQQAQDQAPPLTAKQYRDLIVRAAELPRGKMVVAPVVQGDPNKHAVALRAKAKQMGIPVKVWQQRRIDGRKQICIYKLPEDPGG
jgi:hypothetical protein